jgi:hypothetical protein
MTTRSFDQDDVGVQVLGEHAVGLVGRREGQPRVRRQILARAAQQADDDVGVIPDEIDT